MAYGIAINTMFGLKNITSERVPRLVSEIILGGPARSGSFTAPGGVTDANGFCFPVSFEVFVSMTGSTVSWERLGQNESDFSIMVVRKI